MSRLLRHTSYKLPVVSLRTIEFDDLETTSTTWRNIRFDSICHTLSDTRDIKVYGNDGELICTEMTTEPDFMTVHVNDITGEWIIISGNYDIADSLENGQTYFAVSISGRRVFLPVIAFIDAPEETCVESAGPITVISGRVVLVRQHHGYMILHATDSDIIKVVLKSYPIIEITNYFGAVFEVDITARPIRKSRGNPDDFSYIIDM